MRLSTFGQWAGFALQIIAGALFPVWPSEMLPWSLLVIGTVVLLASSGWYFFTNFRLRMPWVRRGHREFGVPDDPRYLTPVEQWRLLKVIAPFAAAAPNPLVILYPEGNAAIKDYAHEFRDFFRDIAKVPAQLAVTTMPIAPGVAVGVPETDDPHPAAAFLGQALSKSGLSSLGIKSSPRNYSSPVILLVGSAPRRSPT